MGKRTSLLRRDVAAGSPVARRGDTPRGRAMDTATSAEITLQGLVGARRVLIGLMALALLAMLAAPHALGRLWGLHPSAATLAGFAAVLTGWAVLDVVMQRTVLARRSASVRWAGLHLLGDVTALTLLLGLTGGATNPFTLLFFVPITLATQVSPGWTWGVAAYAVASFALLFVWVPLPAAPPGHEHHFAGHLQGMWLAFGVSGLLVTHFVHRIALRLASQREELRAWRERAMTDRHFTSLGTLAAGAAHELGTPLATLTVLVGELPYLQGDEFAEARTTMKTMLQRCKDIVQRMATPDLRIEDWAAERRAWPLTDLAAVEAPTGVTLTIDLPPAVATRTTTQPRAPLLQVLRELLANGADASRATAGASPPLHLAIAADATQLEVRVRDHGIGMSDELRASAFDPFLSTKPEGQGMGLGLYLARAHVRQLGGTIELRPAPERGTEVVVRVPLDPEVPGHP